MGETRDDSKEFVYDHSFLSVDPMDDNFVSQEQVGCVCGVCNSLCAWCV